MNNNEAVPFDRTFAASLLHAAHVVEARMEEAFAKVGLSLARWGVLELLVLSDEALSLGEIAARKSCVRSNMTQLIDRLEAEGCVRRVNDPHDRRSIRAELTEEGRKRYEEGAAEFRAVMEELDASIRKEDRVVLARLLEALPAVQS